MASPPLSLSLSIFLLLSPLISSASSQPFIRLPTEATKGKSTVDDDDLYCSSWHLAVETNNAGSWKTIPTRCRSYAQDYMTGQRYMSDSEIAANFSLAHASSVEIARDGKDAWVFDVDETLLSNLKYYEDHGFGILDGDVNHVLIKILISNNTEPSEIFDDDSFNAWVDLAVAPAIPASLKLYNELKQMGFKIFLLTGRSESQRNVTAKNLLFAGYTDWERLILRGHSDEGTKAIAYKSERRSELLDEGYRIQGNSGDQWSDLQGFAVAIRSFKLPNPMYYIA
ncbi:Acid phosphatase (Class B) [Corchorus olitorius]|uniref:Acid phosphatase (Class B) n=1 Tax=Corchorus olitorius TaxID=93759 RepID=A0A1R3J9P0_9ROSI|nr:Acid phosphatase (Class B) [Corchorus olitorius]